MAAAAGPGESQAQATLDRLLEAAKEAQTTDDTLKEMLDAAAREGLSHQVFTKLLRRVSRVEVALEEAQEKLLEKLDATGPARPRSASSCDEAMLDAYSKNGEGKLYHAYPKSGCNHPVLLGIKVNYAMLLKAMTKNRGHVMTQTLLYHALDFMTVVNEKAIGLKELMNAVGLTMVNRKGLTEAPRVAMWISESGEATVPHETMLTAQLACIVESTLKAVSFKGVHDLICDSDSSGPAGDDGSSGPLGAGELAKVIGVPGCVLQVAKNQELMNRDDQLIFGRRDPCLNQQQQQQQQQRPPQPARQRAGPLYTIHEHPLVTSESAVNRADVVVAMGLKCPQALSVILVQKRLADDDKKSARTRHAVLPLPQTAAYGILQQRTLYDHERAMLESIGEHTELTIASEDAEDSDGEAEDADWASDVAGWPGLDPVIKGAERAWHLDKIPLLMPSGAFVQLWALLPQLRATGHSRLQWLPHLATVLDSVQVKKSKDEEKPASGLNTSWAEEVLRLAALLGAVALYSRYQALGELPAKGAPLPPAGTSLGWLQRAFKDDSCMFLPRSIGADDIELVRCGENAQGLVVKSKSAGGAAGSRRGTSAAAAAADGGDVDGGCRADSDEQPQPTTARQSVYLKSFDYDLRHSNGGAKTKYSAVKDSNKRQIMELVLLDRLKSPDYYGGHVKVFKLSPHASILQRPFLAGRCGIEGAMEEVALLLQLDQLHKPEEGKGAFVFGDVRMRNLVVTDEACKERPQWLEQVHGELVKTAGLSDEVAARLCQAEQRVRLIDCDFAGRSEYPKSWNHLPEERHPKATAGAPTAPEHDIYAAILILEQAIEIKDHGLRKTLDRAKDVLTMKKRKGGAAMKTELAKSLFGDEQDVAAGADMGFQLSLWILQNLLNAPAHAREGSSTATAGTGSPPRDGDPRKKTSAGTRTSKKVTVV